MPSATGFTFVSAAHLQDATGTTITNAIISFVPADNRGRLISFKAGGPAPGQVIGAPVSALVVDGAFTIYLADTSETSPLNVGYSVTVIDSVTGRSLLGQGYGCVQPTGVAWNFDDYVPDVAAQAPQTLGPVGPSNYALALSMGFIGTEADYLASLHAAAVNFRGVYSPTTTYAAGDAAYYTDGISYISLVGSNTSHTPPTSATQWAVLRDVYSKFVDEISVKDFRAIGDGTVHQVQEWLDAGLYDTLAAVQVDYPDVVALTDSIDFAAINAALRYAVANGKGIFLPAGTYLGWIKAYSSNVCIRGEGSSCTKILIPAGATRTVPDNNSGGGATTTGVPCVVDFNCIGFGNSAPALTNGHISGLTLDGNAANTTVPTADLHGWGLSFTAYSNCTYHDIVVQNTHCGGVGVFINSNLHLGRVRAHNCGNSYVDGGYRPGFDVNASRYSVWDVVSDACAVGARFLGNISHCSIRSVALNCVRQGFVYASIPVAGNVCFANQIEALVDGGAPDAGMSVGASCFDSFIRLMANNCQGAAYVEAVQATGYISSGNRVEIISRLTQAQAALITSNSSDYTITSDRDGRAGAQGSAYAVDVSGSNHTIRLRHFDTTTWQVRGLIFRSGANNNIVESYIWDNTADPYDDAGTGNRFLSGRQGVWVSPTLGSGFSNTYTTPFAAIGYLLDDAGCVRLRGHITGTAGTVFALPAGFRPSATMRFFAGTVAGDTVTVNAGGNVDVAGTGPWDLNSCTFLNYV